MVGIIAKVVATLGFGGAVLMQLPPASTPIDSIGRLGLDGCLAVAVVCLWRALAVKDQQVVSMASKVTETMVSVMEAVKELRTTVGELKLEYRDLPCAIRGEHEACTPEKRR